MPEWIRHKGWRFHVYAGDTTMRPHVHMAKPGADLKIWIDTIELAYAHDVKSKDVRIILRYVEDNIDFMRGKWREQFPDR